ncbi:MAG: cytochrome P460 family protein [Candidatus Thiodiazotropha sp.]
MKATKFSLPVILVAGISMSAVGGGQVPYPDGYRTWTHAKSMVIQPGHPLENPFQGIHHVYVNDAAKQGLVTGRYSDGAVFVFDLLSYRDVDRTLQEGDRKLIGVMHKDQDSYEETGGWGFEAFAGDSKTDRVVEDAGIGCFSCHTKVKEKDYVFTHYRN